MAKIVYQWFLEPLDAHTNKVVANFLSSISCLEENILSSVVTEKGEIMAFQMRDYRDISYFLRSKDSLNLRFRIYNRRGNQAQLRQCSFLTKKKKQSAE